MKCIIKQSNSDPNSVDIFDLDKRNETGGMFCVAAAILPEQVPEHWIEYVTGHGPRPDLNSIYCPACGCTMENGRCLKCHTKEALESTPVSNLQGILENWKKVIEGPAQEGPEAGFQHGLKKAYDDIMRAAEWES